MACLALAAPCFSQASVVTVDLSGNSTYQNRTPTQHLGGASLDLDLPSITIGGKTWIPRVFLSRSAGAPPSYQAHVAFATDDSPERDIGYVEAPVFLWPKALAVNDTVSSSDTFSDPAEFPAGTVTEYSIDLSETVSEAGFWTDGNLHYLGFALLDGATKYFGYLGLTVADFRGLAVDPDPKGPIVSITGFAYETSPDTAITVQTIPEPGILSLGLVALLSLAAKRFRRLAQGTFLRFDIVQQVASLPKS